MSLSMAVFTFINVWCILLFVIVPFHVKPAVHKAPKDYVAAPQPVRWRRIFLIDAAVSLLFTALLALLFNSGLFHVDTLK